jgi:hypothetical protein
MTKDDKRWLADVASLGCVVCRNLGYGASPAEIHHIRTGQGIAQRADHKKLTSLRHTTEPAGTALLSTQGRKHGKKTTVPRLNYSNR